MAAKKRSSFKASLKKRVFFEDVGYRPHPGQIEIHDSQALRRIVACGVRWGKSRCAAMEGLAAAMEPRQSSVGWIVAPTYDLTDKVFRELVSIIGRRLKRRIVTLKETERRIVLVNMAGGRSEIRGKSAENPVSLLGEGLDWLVADEAARLKPAMWQSYLSQRLIDRHGWALLISTPKGKGWLYDLFRRGQGNDPDYESWNQPSWENPILDRSLIEQDRARLPERVFRQEYGGEFLEGAGAVFRNVRDVATGNWQEPRRGQQYYAGLDLAKVEDFTVLVIMNGAGEVVFVDRFNNVDWSVQIGRVHAATERFNRATTYVDSTGPGEPIFEYLKKAGIRAVPYVFTQRSKAALIDQLAIAFEEKRITLPRPDLWPEGIEELEAFEYSVTDAGNVSTAAPSGMRDDCVAGLALAGWKALPVRKFRREPNYGKRVVGRRFQWYP